MSRVRIGVIGTAAIAERSIIPAILELDEYFELAGVAGRDPVRTDVFTSKFNTTAFYSYEELLDAKSIQAVYIPLPNSLHFEWVKKALDKGIHVLVEKSMGCSLREVELLNNLAKENRLTLIENFQFRFHSQLPHIRKMVKDGKIGELRCIRSSFGFPPFKDAANIRYQKELGGGALLDAGAYPIKIAQEFLGMDVQVAAANLTMDIERGIDIAGGAYIKQNNGNLFAEIAFGFDHYYQCNIELWGSRGKIYNNRIFTAPPGYSPEIILETDRGKEIIELKPDDHFKNMLLHFHGQVANPNANEYLQNINQSRLIEALKNKANAS